MIEIPLIGWTFALLSLLGSAIFFWREKKIAGFSFVVVFIIVLAAVSDKRLVLRSSMLGITLEREGPSHLSAD